MPIVGSSIKRLPYIHTWFLLQVITHKGHGQMCFPSSDHGSSSVYGFLFVCLEENAQASPKSPQNQIV